MNRATKRIFLAGLLATVIAVLFIAGCSSKNDAISNAEKMEKNRPSIEEPKRSPRKVSSSACPS